MSIAKVLPIESIKITVKITAGPHLGETFVIAKNSFSVGRGAENDIILINDPKLSRNHIKVSVKGSDLHIENLSTRNPIVYKDKTENHVDIKPHDRIKMGDSEIELQWNASILEKTVMATDVATTQLTLATSTALSDGPTVVKPDPSSVTQIVGLTPKSTSALATHEQPNQPISFKSLTSNVEKNNAPPNVFTPRSAQANPASQLGHQQSTPNQVVIPTTSPALKGAHPALKQSGTPLRHNSPAKATGNKSYRPQSRATRSSNSSKTLLIGLGVIGIFVLVLSMGGDKKPKKISLLKDTNQISAELTKTNQIIDDYVKEKKLLEDGRMDRIYESAQSYYVKGFRDYRQGQYSRAIVSFQAALSFDPGHVLAKKYLLQSVKKHSEVVQFNLDQAKRYREKSNYRLCRASAKQVIVMALRKDQTDPMYKEGKKIFDECDILSKGRF